MKEFIDEIIGRDLFNKIMEEEPDGGNLIICFMYLGMMKINENGRLCKADDIPAGSNELANALYDFTGVKFPADEVRRTIERFAKDGLIEKDRESFLVIGSLRE